MSPRSKPVSHVTGHRQARALKVAAALSLVSSGLGLLLPSSIGIPLSVAGVGIIVATPLVRVAWLVRRWAQERDLGFVLLGTALLAVVALGAIASALGLGR